MRDFADGAGVRLALVPLFIEVDVALRVQSLRLCAVRAVETAFRIQRQVVSVEQGQRRTIQLPPRFLAIFFEGYELRPLRATDFAFFSRGPLLAESRSDLIAERGHPLFGHANFRDTEILAGAVHVFRALFRDRAFVSSAGHFLLTMGRLAAPLIFIATYALLLGNVAMQPAGALGILCTVQLGDRFMDLRTPKSSRGKNRNCPRNHHGGKTAPSLPPSSPGHPSLQSPLRAARDAPRATLLSIYVVRHNIPCASLVVL